MVWSRSAQRKTAIGEWASLEIDGHVKLATSARPDFSKSPIPRLIVRQLRQFAVMKVWTFTSEHLNAESERNRGDDDHPASSSPPLSVP
jgi:hypothetical protein